MLTKQYKPEDRDVDSILTIVDVDSNQQTILTEFDYLIEAPNWTPDGQSLIYNSKGRIYSYTLSTSEINEIGTGFATNCNNDHVLSPDGRQFAVSHRTSEDGLSRIYMLSFAGGEPTLITPNASSYLHGWSPDGQTIAYCGERNGQYDIYTIPVSGGVETRLTNIAGLDDGPEYSPDGKFIWFNSTRSGLMQVWRMVTDGSNQTQMTFDEANNWFPHISPDGQHVSYITYYKGDVDPGSHPPNKNVEIRLMSAEGGSFKMVVALFGGQGTMNVNSWSPDNKTLAFVSYRLKEK